MDGEVTEDGSPVSPTKTSPSLSRTKSVTKLPRGCAADKRDFAEFKLTDFRIPADADNGLRLKRTVLGVSCVEPHPTLNYCEYGPAVCVARG